MKRLRDKWPWNAEVLNAILLIPSLIGIVLTAIFYPFAGAQSLWFLSAVVAGVVFRLMYGVVGKKVTKLKAEYRGDPGEVVEGLLVVGIIQAPGIAILRSDELELVPIAGKGYTIPLNELEVFKEGHMLPGKYVWGKRAFILKSHLKKRLAFAVEESIGERWSRIFVNK
jgi:hypothetical protein